MAFTYTQANLQQKMAAGIQNKIGILLDPQETMNTGVRRIFGKVDFRSAIRRSVLSPNLFGGKFPYLCPADLKDLSIIDLPAQAKRYDGEFALVPAEEFARIGGQKSGLIAIDSYNGVNVLMVSSRAQDKSQLISTLDSTTAGGGLWSVFGDAENLEADDADFVEENGSLKFGINSSGGTTAGIVNSSLNTIDISDYRDGTSAIFVWTKINSTTGLTNYILRFGNSNAIYHQKTTTAQADGTAFVTGWNLLKFDITSLTDVGSVVDTAIDYIALYMTKAGSKVSETDYKFDHIIIKKGLVNYIKYYTMYGWQSAAGAYKLDSTDATDYLVADASEYELIAKECVIAAMEEIGYPDAEIEIKRKTLQADINDYLSRNPSEAKVMIYDYYNY